MYDMLISIFQFSFTPPVCQLLSMHVKTARKKDKESSVTSTPKIDGPKQMMGE